MQTLFKNADRIGTSILLSWCILLSAYGLSVYLFGFSRGWLTATALIFFVLSLKKKPKGSEKDV
jgi:hypothetical protein